jgi:DNA-binding transcriptional LysR family regulator
LSRRVSELEEQLGVRLIERGSRRLLSAKVRAFMDLLQDLPGWTR